MDVLRIDYETGFMELYVKVFFPCKIDKAGIVFPLIRRWCDDKTKSELMEDLNEMAAGYKKLCKERETKGTKTGYNEAVTLYKRTMRNIGALKKAR